MPETTYTLLFRHNDSDQTEEYEFTHIEEAWEQFRLFAEPDSSEIYTRIELREYCYTTRTDRLIAALEFSTED